MPSPRTATLCDRLGPAHALLLSLLAAPLGCGDQDAQAPCVQTDKRVDCGASAEALAPSETPQESPLSPPIAPPALPTPSLCSQVKATVTEDYWTFASDHLRLASAGSEVGMVYSRSSRCGVTSPWSIMFQRLTKEGRLKGEPIVLATTYGPSKNQAPPTTVATDGSVYMACWQTDTSGADGIACATLPVGTTDAVPNAAPFAAAGGAPVLSYGHGSFVLRYHHDQPVVQRLSRAGVAIGDAVLFGQKYYSVSGVSAVVPTRSGFLFGARLASNAPAALYALDKELTPIGEGKPTASDPSGLYPAGGRAALIDNQRFMDPYGYKLRYTPVDEDGTAGTAVRVDSATPLSLGPTPFRGAPHSDQLGLLYTSYDSVDSRDHLMFVDLASNGAQGGPRFDLGTAPAASAYSAEQLDITAVPDGFIVAVAEQQPSPRIVITHLGCIAPKSPG